MDYGSHNVVYVGISGKKRHGKDSFARALSAMMRPGHVYIRPFAAALKEEVSMALAPAFREAGVRTVAGQVMQWLNGEDEATRKKEEFRLLMQWWGTEFRRSMCAEDYWLQKLEQWVEGQCSCLMGQKPILVIVPDVRFPDEATFIRDRGGLLVHVARPSVAAEDTHASETALDDFEPWDWQAVNDGSVADLASQAFDFANAHLRARWL